MRKSDITPEWVQKAVLDHGSITKAAMALCDHFENPNGSSVSWTTLRDWMCRTAQVTGILKPGGNEKINRLAELLERSGVDVSAIGEIKSVRLSSWGVHAKNPETGEIETKALYGTKLVLSPSWEQGPKWPLIDQPKPVQIRWSNPRRDRPGVSSNGLARIVIIPDIQFGFLRDIRFPERLTPTHDPAALDIVLQLLEDIRPTQVGYLGDLLDLPEQSKYIQLEEFWRTTQPALDEAYKFLATVQEITKQSRKAETFFISGNHERRLQENILRYNRSAFGLRQAGNSPDSWPVFSLPYLLRFEELGIAHCGEYPGGEKWLTPDLVVLHQPPSKKTNFLASVIHGHSHQITTTAHPVHTREGLQTYYHYDLGCLCGTGKNPDTRSLQGTLVPSDRPRTNWSQGVGVVTIDGMYHRVEQVEIRGGRAIYGGKVYQVRSQSVGDGDRRVQHGRRG